MCTPSFERGFTRNGKKTVSHNHTWTIFQYRLITLMLVWYGGVMLELWTRDQEVNVTNLCKLFTHILNHKRPKGQWCSVAWKSTVGLAVSNGRLALNSLCLASALVLPQSQHVCCSLGLASSFLPRSRNICLGLASFSMLKPYRCLISSIGLTL